MYNFLAKELAEYLILLDKSEEAYGRYFDWRFQPPGLSALRSRDPWCSLCEKLIYKLDNRENIFSSIYEDINSWWFHDGPCIKNLFTT